MPGDDKPKLKALSDIASIDITLEFNAILGKILENTCNTIGAHSGTIMLVDEDSGKLSMVASYGLPDNYIEMVYDAAEKAGVSITSSPSGTVLKTGKYYLVPNIYEEPKDKPWYRISSDLGFSSQIFTPMKQGSKVVGLLNIYWEKPRQFQDEDIDFVSIAASQASSVVQNARMCRRLKTNLMELNEYKEHLEEKVKETSQKLFDSEQYLRTIINSSFDVIFVLDDKGRVEFANEAFFSYHSWSKEKLIGKVFMEFFHDDMREFMFERWHEMQNDIKIPYETQLKTKNGFIYLYVSHAKTEIKGETKYVVIIKDISDYKKLLLDLKESELYLRTVVNSSFDGIFVIDNEGKFEYGNESFVNILGWSKDELIGKGFMEVIPEDMHGFMLRKWDEIQKGIQIPYETKIITKNGETRNLYVSHAKTEMKGRAKYVVVIKDITDYKKLILELKESEVKYRELFENAQDPMYIHDTQGFIKSMNDVGCRLLGCTSREEVAGTHFSQWLTPESFEYAQKTLIQHITGQPVEQPIVLEVVCKNGEHKWAEIKNRVIIEGGTITGIHGIARDITEKKKLEQQLKESYEKLMEADKLKTEFISNVTHELLTPMTAIKGFTELIKDGTLGSINNEQVKGLDTIFRNAERLTNLINQLLQAAHLENDAAGMHYGQVSMNDIISQAVVDVQPQAVAKQIRIINNAAQVPEITGDGEKLYGVIVNLLVNAVKFTPKNGKITVNAHDNRSSIHISISDTGIGIPAGELSRIFDRFYQVDGSESRKYGGTGIGLSLCRSVVEKHNGTIRAESNGVKGSTFHIELPKKQD
ncbi:MAG: PAS domain S-box protein [Candidatus Methanoperedens sp.]|jgi:PAS domain S-box-containing protein|nr:PAS domain S-box protein [Candidatus Methanoperedens sp.]PKL53148.1 MAG: hypothetical protein CVV36_08640 [Candidatus Methanoperedenaceae archaeon HGW-Methanoperedenaceae-1]